MKLTKEQQDRVNEIAELNRNGFSNFTEMYDAIDFFLSVLPATNSPV